MIDREKVAVMTQEARHENKNRTRVFPAANFYMFDYVSFQVVKGLIGGTMLFMVFVAGWLIYTLDEWITSYSMVQLIAMLKKIGMVYGCAMLALAVILALTYSLRYIQSKALLEEERHNLKKLERFNKHEKRERGE